MAVCALLALLLIQNPLILNESGEYEEEQEEGDKSDRAMGRYEQEWLMTHDPATGIIPGDRLLKAHKVAQDRRQQMTQRSGIIPIFWQEEGPCNVGGRTRGLIFDASDSKKNPNLYI